MIDLLLLLGLPASGKSEIRRYLDGLDPARRAADLRLGVPVHLDDYPYVHLMRRISQELRRRSAHPVFFATDAEPMLEPGDWLTLAALLAEDYAGLGRPPAPPEHPAARLLNRFDRARAAAGLPSPFAGLPSGLRAELEGAIADEAAVLLPPLAPPRPAPPTGCTVVMEFSRGASQGMRPPFPTPWGYAHSLSALSPDILERAACLYVWVTPTESRRRNRERAHPGGEGSTLYHGVPERVMRHDYAGDDVAWLLDHADRSGHITLAAHGRRYQIPAVRFDNRVDRTSFLRDDPAAWPPQRVACLHQRLTATFTLLLRRGRLPA
ncbi:MAG TPA: hypothetical protein VMX37_02440 [Acidimicrobiia bacterium]|nr:hypothetical protein [Acidimicrobiia bacterium]